MARIPINSIGHPTVSQGIVHVSGSNLVYLSLEQVDVHAQIVDVSATVTLTQTFWQNMSIPTSRAKYVFPIPAGAAICGFEMRTETGTVITAVAKEKETARKEHEEALTQGNMTGLVELVAQDVFTVSLGCLPSLGMVTTKLTYVMDLLEDDFTDQVRLLLPVCIGMRYGTPPPGAVGASIIPEERITISVDVFTKGEIRSITSPSHPTVSLVDGISLSSVPNACCKTAQYHSPYFLARDFILSIKSDGLDTPRCFAQRNAAGSVAMQLTLIPKVTLPNIPQQEYIFLVDRSGSMNGARIATAKRALVMLLRALPISGTTFNIFSFGNDCDSLWNESQVYNEENLQAATQHVDSMDANYGGTEIRRALEKIFETRCITSSTACFVLTDGNAYDVSATILKVTEAVSAARPDAPLRAFTLGIGGSTSTAMCMGIARAGNGICLMAATEETIVAKCTKLVKASRTPILDVDIDWGAPVESLHENHQAATMLQGPSRVPPLYSVSRFIVFALSQDPNFIIPDQVHIQARCRGMDDVLKLSVPVETIVDAPSGGPQRPLIHTMTAKRIITDLEDNKNTQLPDPASAIIHLGEQYQLASRYTSFIAVEDNKDPRPASSAGPEALDRPPSPSFVTQFAPSVTSGRRRHTQRMSTGGKAARKMLAAPAARKASTGPNTATPSGGSDPVRKQPGRACKKARVEDGAAVPVSVSANLPPVQSASGSDQLDTLLEKLRSGEGPRRKRTPASTTTQAAPLPPPVTLGTRSRPEEDEATKLVRLQSFDGSFAVSAALAAIVGQSAVDARTDIEPATVWATVLAIVYLQKHMTDQPELLESLAEKALEYVRKVWSADVESLLSVARGLVQ